MSTETAIAGGAGGPKQPAKGVKPSNPLEDGAIRIRKLLFGASGGVDLPTEQRRASISDIPRTGLTSYRIWFLPRIGMYLVRAYEFGKESGRPSHTFIIPADWAVAEFAEQ